MHSKLKIGFIALATVFLLFSCNDLSNLQAPESVSVKTDATYKAALGSITKPLSDYLSASDLQKKLADPSTDVSVYDYNPDGTATMQEYLIEYPLYNYQLDFSQEFDDIAASSGFTQKGSYTLSIPVINQSFSNDITVNVSDQVGSPALSSTSVILPESPVEQSISGISVPITIDNIGTASYSSGTMDITLTPVESLLDYKTITATLKNSSGSTITSGTSSENVTGSTPIVISLPLSNKTLTASMTLVLGGTISNGTLGKSDSYTASVTMDSAILSEVTGLTATVSGIDLSQSITVSASTVDSATIDEGTLAVAAGVPTGWSGVTCDVSGLGVSGGLSPTNSFTDGSGSGLFSKTLDLHGASFTPANSVSVSGTAALTFSDATVVFDSSGEATVSVSASCSVTKLSSATVSVNSSDVPSFTINQKLSDLDFASAVSQISGAQLTISGTYVNGLPSNNNMNLSLSSSYLTLSGNASSGFTVTSGGTEITSTDTSAPRDIDVASDTIDLTASILLPGQSLSTDDATFTDITLGTDYKMTASFAVSMDWQSVTVDANSVSTQLNQTGSQNVPINLNSILADFSTGIGLKSLPVYLYVVAPKAVTDNFSTATAKLTATYTYDNDGTDKTVTDAKVLPDSSTTDTTSTLTLLNSDIDLGDTSDTYTGTISSSSYSAMTDGLVAIINKRPSDMTLNYEISLTPSSGTVTINKAALDSSSIDVKAVIEVPLQMDITTSSTIDLLDLAGMDTNSDLFKRNEATSTSDIEKYFDAIKSFNIVCSVTNKMFTFKDSSNNEQVLSVSFDPKDSSDNSIFSSPYTLTSSGGTITVTGNDITSLLGTYPVTAADALILTIPVGTLTVSRDAYITAGMNISISTDGTVTLFGGNN